MFVFAATLVSGYVGLGGSHLAERWGSGPKTLDQYRFLQFLAAGDLLGLPQTKARRAWCCAAHGYWRLSAARLTIPTGVLAIFIGFAWSASRSAFRRLSAAAGLDDTHEAQNIATMAMIAMSGFLVGPPLIGFVAEAFLLVSRFLGLFSGPIRRFLAIDPYLSDIGINDDQGESFPLKDSAAKPQSNIRALFTVTSTG
jgi:hypothetical protein